jgi:hypothetical protein
MTLIRERYVTLSNVGVHTAWTYVLVFAAAGARPSPHGRVKSLLEHELGLLAKADVALIISTALPKGVETFDLIDGVYVAHPHCAVPVALTLRQGLLEVANARTSQAGQRSKAEQVYQYLTGTQFKQRIEAIVERFKDMRDDIDRERKFMMKAWAKREAQVNIMIDSTVGMVGDLQGIMGQAMPEISAIEEPPMIEGKAA